MNGMQLKLMTKPKENYKRAEFEEDETSSNGSVPADAPSLGRTQVVYHKGLPIWDRRSLLEKILLVLTAVLLLLVIIFSSVISVLNKSQPIRVVTSIDHVSKNLTTSYCLSPECITVASSIINSMDHGANPCEDFYQYACGGWIKTNPIPEGKSIWGTFGKLRQENQLVMKNVLEKHLSENSSQAERKAQIYYLSCLDTNGTIEKLGAAPLKELISELGGWNIFGDFDLSRWNFQNIIQVLHNKYNMGGFFAWVVVEDDKNSSVHTLTLDQSGLTLPTRDYYLNKSDDDEVLVAYLKYMTQVGVLLGGEENATREEMRKVIELETRLANITIPSDERREGEKMYNKMTLSNLTQLAPVLDWVQYFNEAFKQVGREIKSTDFIVVAAPEYVGNLSAILTEYLSTTEGKNILNNYLMWHMTRYTTSFLSKPFKEAAKILQRALLGTDGEEVQWRNCVSNTDNVIGFSLGAMFVREVFHGESKLVAEQMIDEIRLSFKKNLDQLLWLDTKTKSLAKEKLDAITDMIGFPDYILNAPELDAKYDGLEFKEEEYFNNNIVVAMFMLKKNVEKLDKLVNKTQWGMSPPTVNAYYTPTKNQIVFPAGILQSPFYDLNYPRSLNFGAMGVVMGHEITHAFDDQGREYDKDGNMNKWWDNATIEEFNKRTQCMTDQYSNYTINDEHLNGRHTLGENIADNGGLKAAFHAYEDWLLANHDELPLPGVNITHQQLFFVAFAQVWCSSSTKAANHLEILNDPHSPSKSRVIGPLSNSHEFSKHFKCPPGSTMNPISKCDLW